MKILTTLAVKMTVANLLQTLYTNEGSEKSKKTFQRLLKLHTTNKGHEKVANITIV